MAVGLIAGVLDGGIVPPIDSSSGEISSRVRFLEVAEALMVMGAEAGTGSSFGAGSVDMIGAND